jgi:hypothetical protein
MNMAVYSVLNVQIISKEPKFSRKVVDSFTVNLMRLQAWHNDQLLWAA